MSTPVLEKPMVDQSADAHTRIVERNGHDVPCEYSHVTNVKDCSGDVSYRLVWCIAQRNVCANTIEHPTEGIAVRRVPGRNCRDCQKPTTDCWRWWPI